MTLVGTNSFGLPHRDNLLKGRVSLPLHAYHVTTCTEARRPIFRDFACARLLVAEMRRLHEAELLDSLAWVVMPDHLHWLFQLGERESLSSTIKRLKARSALAIGRHVEPGAPIWQRGFYDHAIRGGDDLLVVARYIVANPLRAGLVEHIGDYPLRDAIWL
jgi:putative transposase